jgi:hypothetical protein
MHTALMPGDILGSCNVSPVQIFWQIPNWQIPSDFFGKTWTVWLTPATSSQCHRIILSACLRLQLVTIEYQKSAVRVSESSKLSR